MPSLVLIKSPGAASANQTYPLTGPLYVLGREETCDIVVANHAVSRKHAQISQRVGGQFYVEDLKSRNGTTVNNEPVTEPRLLKHDDRLKICDFLYRFHDEAAANRPPLPSGLSSSSLLNEREGAADSQSTIEHAFMARGTEQLLNSQPTERLRALLDISTALSRTMVLQAMMESIADKVLDVFRQADRCFVIIREEGDRLVPKVVRLRRAMGSDDDQRFSRTIVRKCFETGEAYLSEDASNDTNLGAAMSVAEFRIRSVMCVPLATPEGQPIGALQIDTQDRTKKFRTADLELLAIVANLAAIAVDKARLHEAAVIQEKQQNEIELARQVQLGILPQHAPPLDGYEFYHHYSAALTVGGDYYDFIPLPDGRIAVLLGDVAGKGVPASLLMAKLSAEARFCMLTQPTLVAAIMLLNNQLINGGIGDRFVSLAAAVIDPVRHVATLVSAGHQPAPILVRRGEILPAISSDDTGFFLGLMPDSEYKCVDLPLNAGDNLLIFTDGVTDAIDPSGNPFEMAGVRKVLADSTLNRPTSIGEKVIKSVKTHAAGKTQNDDIAFVCVGRLLDGLPKAVSDTGSIHPQVRKEAI